MRVSQAYPGAWGCSGFQVEFGDYNHRLSVEVNTVGAWSEARVASPHQTTVKLASYVHYSQTTFLITSENDGILNNNNNSNNNKLINNISGSFCLYELR